LGGGGAVMPKTAERELPTRMQRTLVTLIVKDTFQNHRGESYGEK